MPWRIIDDAAGDDARRRLGDRFISLTPVGDGKSRLSFRWGDAVHGLIEEPVALPQLQAHLEGLPGRRRHLVRVEPATESPGLLLVFSLPIEAPAISGPTEGPCHPSAERP